MKHPDGSRSLWRMFARQLPLQSETTVFILVNVLDIFVTRIVLEVENGAEANPIARFFLDRWDFAGMIFFKMGVVAFVCVVSQIIARYRLTTARRVLQAGTLIVILVVFYGLFLLFLSRPGWS